MGTEGARCKVGAGKVVAGALAGDASRVVSVVVALSVALSVAVAVGLVPEVWGTMKLRCRARSVEHGISEPGSR